MPAKELDLDLVIRRIAGLIYETLHICGGDSEFSLVCQGDLLNPQRVPLISMRFRPYTRIFDRPVAGLDFELIRHETAAGVLWYFGIEACDCLLARNQAEHQKWIEYLNQCFANHDVDPSGAVRKHWDDLAIYTRTRRAIPIATTSGEQALPMVHSPDDLAVQAAKHMAQVLAANPVLVPMVAKGILDAGVSIIPPLSLPGVKDFLPLSDEEKELWYHLFGFSNRVARLLAFDVKVDTLLGKSFSPRTLAMMPRKLLLNVPGIGPQTANEIEEVLRQHGIVLPTKSLSDLPMRKL